MLIARKVYTKAEFYDFIRQPQNVDRVFELIDGEIVEKMPSFGYSSGLGARMTTFIGMYLLEHDIAHLTDAQDGYEIDDENALAPDIGLVLKSHLPELPDDSFVPMRPDLVVEVVSVSDLKDPDNRIEKKLQRYISAGVPLIWYLFPEREQVEVHKKGEPKQVMGLDDMLDGGEILPGFTLSVRKIFGK